MSINPNEVWEPTSDHRTPAGTLHSEAARDHLWMHFTRHSVFEDRTEGGLGHTVPIITKGQGWKIWDDRGNEYIDGLAGLFVVQVGHGREELAEAAAKQAKELAFFPLWSYAHPKAIELAERLASHAPGDLNRVFFTTGGGEAVETAWKLAKQYFKLTGKPTKHKVISRNVAYHGTPQGALSITGIPAAKEMFEPLVPGAHKVPNTNLYRAPEHLRGRREGLRPLGRRPHRRGHRVRGPRHRRGRLPRAGAELRWLLPAARRLLRARPRDLRRVRRAPRVRRGDLRLRPHRLDVRLRRLRLRARHHHLRQGHDERLLPHRRDDRERPALRAVQARARRTSRTATPSVATRSRPRSPWPTSTSSSARASTTGSRRTPRSSRPRSTSCSTCPLVGDVRGAGYFYGIELVKDKATRETFNDAESERLLRGFLSKALFDAGLYCRADDRGDPVIQLAPPLIMGPEQFDDIESRLRSVLTEAENHL